jgi:hypothetical protein
MAFIDEGLARFIDLVKSETVAKVALHRKLIASPYLTAKTAHSLGIGINRPSIAVEENYFKARKIIKITEYTVQSINGYEWHIFTSEE